MGYFREKLAEYGLVAMNGKEPASVEWYQEEYSDYGNDSLLPIITNEQLAIMVKDPKEFVTKMGLNEKYAGVSILCYDAVHIEVDSSEEYMDIRPKRDFLEVKYDLARKFKNGAEAVREKDPENYLWSLFASPKQIEEKVYKMVDEFWDIFTDQDADVGLKKLRGELIEALEKDRKKVR